MFFMAHFRLTCPPIFKSPHGSIIGPMTEDRPCCVYFRFFMVALVTEPMYLHVYSRNMTGTTLSYQFPLEVSFRKLCLHLLGLMP
jgi:hypothetical protein